MYYATKSVCIGVPSGFGNVDYSWIFEQFSENIKENIKAPDENYEYLEFLKSYSQISNNKFPYKNN